MRRIDLPEVADLAWCPRWLQEALLGYLNVVLTVDRPYDVVAGLSVPLTFYHAPIAVPGT
jgi:hypothetical protein